VLRKKLLKISSRLQENYFHMVRPESPVLVVQRQLRTVFLTRLQVQKSSEQADSEQWGSDAELIGAVWVLPDICGSVSARIAEPAHRSILLWLFALRVNHIFLGTQRPPHLVPLAFHRGKETQHIPLPRPPWL
jgi:hypothetical protein